MRHFFGLCISFVLLIEYCLSAGPSFLNARLPLVIKNVYGKKTDVLVMNTPTKGEIWDIWGYYQGGTPPPMWYFLPNTQKCSGREQSPINILSKNVFTTNLPAFDFSDLQNTAGVEMEMINDGRRVEVDYHIRHPIIKGGGLDGAYELKSFHFHWGRHNGRGSEHTIDNLQHAMELHFELKPMKAELAGSTESKKVAVLAVMINVGAFNPKFSQIVDKLFEVTEVGGSTHLQSFPATDLLPNLSSCFYRYTGSLTTPPCSESVTWTIFCDVVYISEYQMDVFRTVKGKPYIFTNPDQRMEDTYRPVQSLNGREVLYSCPPVNVNGYSVFNHVQQYTKNSLFLRIKSKLLNILSYLRVI